MKNIQIIHRTHERTDLGLGGVVLEEAHESAARLIVLHLSYMLQSNDKYVYMQGEQENKKQMMMA